MDIIYQGEPSGNIMEHIPIQAVYMHLREYCHIDLGELSLWNSVLLYDNIDKVRTHSLGTWVSMWNVPDCMGAIPRVGPS